MQEKYHKHISAKHNLLDLKLGEVWKSRELAWLFTKRDFKVAYKQTILGPMWLFIRPILTSIVHVIVFGLVAGLTTGGVPQFLFHLTSTAIWTYFSSCLTSSSNTFLGNARLFGKVYFPRLITPISDVLSNMIRFAIQMILVIILLCYYIPAGAVSPNFLAWLLIPVVLIWLGLMGMGLGIIISSVTTKYRDLTVLVGFGTQLLMYASPVVYPLGIFNSSWPLWLKNFVVYNPLTAPIEILRYAILGSGTVPLSSLITSLSFTAVVIFFGIILFNKVERTFLDTI